MNKGGNSKLSHLDLMHPVGLGPKLISLFTFFLFFSSPRVYFFVKHRSIPFKVLPGSGFDFLKKIIVRKYVSKSMGFLLPRNAGVESIVGLMNETWNSRERRKWKGEKGGAGVWESEKESKKFE